MSSRALTIVEWVEGSAARHGDRLAIFAPGEAVKYWELWHASGRIAAHLRHDLGVSLGDRVSVDSTPGVGTLVQLLGVLRAGAAYVPLDAAYPAERNAHVLLDTQPSASLNGSLKIAELPERDVDPSWAPSAEDLAYVLHTSGSTGRPKGVEILHRNVAGLLSSVERVLSAEPDDCWSWAHSLCFDFSVWEIFGAWSTGGCVHVPPVGCVRDGDAFADFLAERRITVLSQVPSSFYRMRERVPGLPDLRRVVFGGETLDCSCLAEVHRTRPELELINMFGITETTVHVTWHRVRTDDIASSRAVVGEPLPGVEIRLVNAEGERAREGEVGELLVAGWGVARAYLGQAELTAARFVHLDGRRFYRSGDLARRDPDGSLIYVGRSDRQIQLRGFRVELGEVEWAIRQLTAIEDCAVITWNEGETTQLVACHVSTSAVSVGVLRSQVSARLPEHMIPHRWVEIDELPLTASFKVDRTALVELVREAISHSSAASDPTGPHSDLGDIIGDILGIGTPDPDASFIELGGDSLSAMRVAALVRRRLGGEVSVRQLLAPVPLTQMIVHPTRRRPSAANCEGTLPLTPAQQRIALDLQFEGEAGAYNVPLIYAVDGRLDADLLGQGLARLAANHPLLGAVFQLATKTPSQRMDAVLDWSVPVYTVTDVRAREAKLAELTRRRFELDRAPLVRAAILREAAASDLLVLVFHHLIVDGWSLRILLDQLPLAYEEARACGPSTLPEPSSTYVDYLAVEPDELSVDHWRRELTPLPPRLALPRDRPPGPVRTVTGGSVSGALPVTRALVSFARATGEGVFACLLAAVVGLAARRFGQRDVVVGVPFAARPPGFEETVGVFVNPVPVRVRVNTSGSFRALARAAARAVESARAHCLLPFEAIVAASRVGARGSASFPIFDVLVHYQRDVDYLQLRELGGCRLEQIREPRGVSLWELSFNFLDQGDELLFELEYSDVTFDLETAEWIHRELAAFLILLLESPDSSLSSCALASDADIGVTPKIEFEF